MKIPWLILLLFSTPLFADTYFMPALPLRPLNPLKDKIPAFHFLRREYKLHGQSIATGESMDSSGAYTAVSGACGSSDSKAWGAEAWESKADWKIRFEGWQAETESLKVIFRTKTGEAPIVYDIPNLTETFGPRPLFYDQSRDQFYFLVADGATGARKNILMRATKSKGLVEIGETFGFQPVLSPDKKWILWPSGEIYSSLGDKQVNTCNLRLFSIERSESVILTRGVALNEFCAWE